MPASLGALAAKPPFRLEWGIAPGLVEGVVWANPRGASWTSGQTWLPFDSATPSTGDSPTSYVLNGQTYTATVADTVVVGAATGGPDDTQRAIFYDLLWVGPIVNGTTATQTIGSGTLPARDILGGANGEGCHLLGWGQSTAALTVSYTNSAGVAGRTALAAARAVNGGFEFTLDTGDTGVKSVQTVTSTTTSPYRIGLVRRLAVAQRSDSPSAPPTQQRRTSRLHNLMVVPAGAVIFPQWGIPSNNAAHYAAIDLVWA